MKKKLGVFVLFAIVVAVAIQFVPVARTNPPVAGDMPAPPEIKTLLRNACYDCHSHETAWPWYSRVAPVSWLVASDVKEGREHLDFSTWPSYKVEKQKILLSDAAEQIREHEMPLPQYMWMHPASRLTDAQRRQLVTWLNSAAGE